MRPALSSYPVGAQRIEVLPPPRSSRYYAILHPVARCRRRRAYLLEPAGLMIRVLPLDMVVRPALSSYPVGAQRIEALPPPRSSRYYAILHPVARCRRPRAYLLEPAGLMIRVLPLGQGSEASAQFVSGQRSMNRSAPTAQVKPLLRNPPSGGSVPSPSGVPARTSRSDDSRFAARTG